MQQNVSRETLFSFKPNCHVSRETLLFSKQSVMFYRKLILLSIYHGITNFPKVIIIRPFI